MSQFLNKVVVVTGGSDGIGKALVEAFLQQGAKVATCGRNYDKLYQLQSTHSTQPLLIHTADVSKEQDCKQFIDQVIKSFGTIDILINNAGVSMRALVEDVELDTIRKVMDINFWGTVCCTKFALPHIIKNKGTVVGVSSIAGYRGLPGRSGYSASKFAVHGWLEALRTELLDSGVNVMWVCPGFTSSNIRNAALNKAGQSQGESPMDEGKMMSSEACAQHILKAIEKRKRTIVLTFTGKETVLLNRFFPSLADKLVRKFFFKNGELVK
ncbi:SDR family oxidoreductase [Sediminibacterium goheungense]|uniref:Short-subunit dehydrogenase n=1 Tax=Sediminibacterium goheungense TaxID=1086393 RepID=A0A4R6ITE6_9BACT|nr:SDR family oxidoreductase [Sediminibacterium goheungense]TDO25809.1 short-subunit dehydrogenase [Sediminibacterium goheungense]